MAVGLEADAAEQLRSWWFCLLSEIADLELQRRTWLDRTNRNPHWSYIEFVSSFPGCEQISQGLREGWLTAGEFAVLNELRRVLDGYSPPGHDPYDNAAVLGDPAWHSVVEAAGRAKRQLLATTTDGRERAAPIGAA